MPPKRNSSVKRGGSIASDAVMEYVPENAFHVISGQNFFEGESGGSQSGGRGRRRVGGGVVGHNLGMPIVGAKAGGAAKAGGGSCGLVGHNVGAPIVGASTGGARRRSGGSRTSRGGGSCGLVGHNVGAPIVGASTGGARRRSSTSRGGGSCGLVGHNVGAPIVGASTGGARRRSRTSSRGGGSCGLVGHNVGAPIVGASTGGARRRGGKRGGAPTNASGAVVGQGEIGRIGFPEFPQANARFDLGMVPTVQQNMAAQSFHTMGAMNRGLVYPNIPNPVNNVVFGGGSRRKKNNGR